MAKITFSKPAITPERLLEKLKFQGLIVKQDEEPQALNYLRFVGAYRLKGYWHHVINPITKKFPSGYSYKQLIDRCEFDRELRAATNEAIERLEVAIRSAIANYLSLKHSPHWFLNTGIFKPTAKWGVGQFIKKIEDEVGRSKEKIFVAHYAAQHDEPYLPPSWSISECVSLGIWSRTYEILRDPNDKKAISMRFKIDQTDVFQSWVHAITVMRNIVAHHGQLLKIKFRITPMGYKNASIKFSDNNSFFSVATVINYLLLQIGLPQRWQKDLEAIFEKYPSIHSSEIGFPAIWRNTLGWE
jgi:abortive infection bacteriophage resistance protein